MPISMCKSGDSAERLASAQSGLTPSQPQLLPGAKTMLLIALLSCTLVAWNFFAYGNSLRIGFFCDDFVHLAFFKQVADQQRWLALLECFGQPYLNATRELYYRPLVETSIAIDSIIWRGEAFGFHLTNILIHLTTAFLLAWNIFQLLVVADPRMNSRQRLYSSFSCAALFSVYPLLGESVIWMIGRVDSLCSMFYLASFGCFQKYVGGGFKKWLALSLICFSAALCCKEMAATLPAVTLLFCVMFAPSRMRAALSLWALLVGYFGVRWLVLGTPLGGPVAVRSLHAPFVARLTDFVTYWRVVFPVKDSLPHADMLLRALQVLWLSAAVLLLRFRNPGRASVFCFFWALLALVPALPVWYIGAEMENGRFVYLFSAPLLSALVLAFFNLRSKLSLIPLGLLAGCYFLIASANVQSWVTADVESKQFIESVRKLRTPVCIVNPPLIKNGVYEFFTATSVHLALQLLPSDEAAATIGRTALLEPIFRPTQEHLINISIIRDELKRAQKQVLIWTGTDLVPINDQPAQDVAPQKALVNAPTPVLPPAYLAESRLLKFVPAISTLDFDYIDIDIKATKAYQTPHNCWLTVVAASKSGTLPLVNIPFTGSRVYRVGISDRLDWLKQKHIESVEVRLSDCAWRVNSLSAAAKSKSGDSPSLVTPGRDNEGVVRTTADTRFRADATRIAGAAKMTVRVSNAHYRLMESKWSIFQAPVSIQLPGKSFVIESTESAFTIPAAVLPDPRAYYELRVGALDKQGNPIGYWSDPVSIKLSTSDSLRGGGMRQ